MGHSLDWLGKYVFHLHQWLPEMLLAAVGTLELTLLSFALAIAIGLVLGLARLSRRIVVRIVASAYITIVRGTPPLVILALIYFGLPSFNVPWLVLSSFAAAVLGLGIHGAAFTAEIFRSGVQALHKGQREAALSVGMTPAQSMRWIILPQATRIIVPPLGNFSIGLLKDTAICSIIAAPELMLRAKDLTSTWFLPMQLYVLAAVIYLAMSYPLSILVRALERRLGRSSA